MVETCGGAWPRFAPNAAPRADKMGGSGMNSPPQRRLSELTRRDLLAATAIGLVGAPTVLRAAAPQGELTWGLHVSLAPTWFDPAETPGLITPFMVLYALQ